MLQMKGFSLKRFYCFRNSSFYQLICTWCFYTNFGRKRMLAYIFQTMFQRLLPAKGFAFLNPQKVKTYLWDWFRRKPDVWHCPFEGIPPHSRIFDHIWVEQVLREIKQQFGNHLVQEIGLERTSPQHGQGRSLSLILELYVEIE